MAGSSSFFDASVGGELLRLGVNLQDTSLGSLQVCMEPGLIAQFDVADSGSDDAATCVEQLVTKAGKVPDKISPYTSPMVIITRTPIVGLLERIGVVAQVNGLTIFNVRKYLNVFNSGETWAQIPGNASYQSLSRILLWTTDPGYSNSGGMLAAIAYAAQNADHPVTTLKPGDWRVQVIKSLFTELGDLQTHTPDLLEQFLAQGMAGIPMAMVYEDDYLNARLTREIPANSDITVMYPNPDVITQDTLVSWTPKGDKLNALLTTPTMEAYLEAYGYRTSQDADSFVGYMAKRGITVPDLNVLHRYLQFTPMPSETSLLALINAVAG